jgi:succinate dehydrogenase / fumarate reductase cytochrome b subunit
MVLGVWMLQSSIGKKVVMALTGFGLFVFVIGHMLGNLQVFLGRAALNGYAEKLHSLPALLWGVRGGLLAIFVVHVLVALRLARGNREARPIGYMKEDTVAASYASRTMVLSGLVVAVFILYHLAHFTFRVVHLPNRAFVEHLSAGHQRFDVYAMVVLGFRSWLVSGLYIAAQIVLGMHLSHGVSSLLQTLGLNCPRCAYAVEKVGLSSAAIIVAGNVAIPLAVLTGLVGGDVQ